MNTATQSTDQSTPQQPTAVLEGRFAALQFPPYFHAVMSTSSLGCLGEVWNRLREDERSDLIRFERALRQGHRLDLLGKRSEAAERYHALVKEFPRFRLITEELLRAMGQPVKPSDSHD